MTDDKNLRLSKIDDPDGLRATLTYAKALLDGEKLQPEFHTTRYGPLPDLLAPELASIERELYDEKWSVHYGIVPSGNRIPWHEHWFDALVLHLHDHPSHLVISRVPCLADGQLELHVPTEAGRLIYIPADLPHAVLRNEADDRYYVAVKLAGDYKEAA